jgi:hypothetical protein
MYVLKDSSGNPVRGFPYKVTLADGRTVQGVTDAQGWMQRLYSGNQQTGMDAKPGDIT